MAIDTGRRTALLGFGSLAVGATAVAASPAGAATSVRLIPQGSTVLTQIHHRQTPLFLMRGRADAGVTWKSEAIFQEQAGHPISHVDIPAGQNTTAVYAGAKVSGAPHPDAARLWLTFIHSPAALSIFERYGFKP